jgi:uncharacterized protein
MALAAIAWLAPPASAAIPEPVGHVNDFADVIDAETEAQLEEELAALARETGAEVAVAAVDRVPDGDIDRAAVEWFAAWGVGRRGRDDGVLILCAVGDRRVRIEVGYGLEPVLPDAVAGRIIRERMAPAFREGRYGEGLAAGARAVAERIRSGAVGDTEDGAAAPGGEFPWLEVLVVALILGVVAYQFAAAARSAAREDPEARRRRRGRWDRDDWATGGFSGGGGFGGGGGGGGFGGFGGGSSGGGGASGSW